MKGNQIQKTPCTHASHRWRIHYVLEDGWTGQATLTSVATGDSFSEGDTAGVEFPLALEVRIFLPSPERTPDISPSFVVACDRDLLKSRILSTVLLGPE